MKSLHLFYSILAIYLIIVTIHLYSCFHHQEELRKVTKCLLMPILALIYYLGCSKEKFSKVILLAIFFGYLGDVFLIIENLFLLGVASFLIGHLLYIITFLIETGFKNYRKNLSYKSLSNLSLFYFLVDINFITKCFY